MLPATLPRLDNYTQQHTMHQSLFSFPITRNYPYKWFTPSVVIGGIIATALFSLLNFAASGYSLVGRYTGDPNATIASQGWVRKWPAFIAGSTQPTCEPTVIPINTVFQTNNTALTFTLTHVYFVSGADVKSEGSVPYYNNPLELCNVSSIRVLLQSIGSSAAQNAIQFWNADVSADVTCRINIDRGFTFLNITASYNLVPPSGQPIGFSGRNATSKPALWWAESLSSAYWIQTTAQMFQENTDKASSDYTDHWMGPVYKGTMQFSPQNDDARQDITSLNYYQSPSCFFETFNPNGTFADGPYCGGATVGELSSAGPNFLGSIWVPADSLAKSIQSTILTDLGQTRPLQANILGDAATLEYFTRNISDIINSTMPQNTMNGDNVKQDSRLAQSAYSASDATRPLTVPPSVISTTYFCQIPQRKSTSSLLIALILADLVFLQATWKIFILVVDAYTARRYPELNCGAKFDTSHRESEGGYSGVAQETEHTMNMTPTRPACQGKQAIKVGLTRYRLD